MSYWMIRVRPYERHSCRGLRHSVRGYNRTRCARPLVNPA